MLKKLLIFWILTNFPVNGEMHQFPIGEKPSVSLQTALVVLEKQSLKITGTAFNPRSAVLIGSEKPGKGSWQFIQADKDGKIFRCVFFFPEDLCVIFDETDGQKFLAAFTRTGKTISKELTKWKDEKEKADPFLVNPK